MTDAVVGLCVLAALIAIALIALGFLRIAVRVFGIAVLCLVGWTLLHGHLPSISAPGSRAQSDTFQVVAARNGGWDVAIPATPGATEYRVYLDGERAGTTTTAGTIHVSERPILSDQYLPGAVRKFRLVSLTPKGKRKETTDWCSPVVYVSARGTWEDKGKASFGHGMGSRGWRTWMKLAQQLGISPSEANVLPTIVGGSPVVYPATVVAKKTSGYANSRNEGVVDLIETIGEVEARCPDSRMVLFGYSQGADVVESVWQRDETDPDAFLGVVSFADPHFNKKWADQLTLHPEGGKWTKNGLLGKRATFDRSELAGLQIWCLPGDPVCQANPFSNRWHGWEYDCFEYWAAYHLAGDVAPYLRARGYEVADPAEPSCTPSTQKSKDNKLSYEDDPVANMA